jgi:hypothetical protein
VLNEQLQRNGFEEKEMIEMLVKRESERNRKKNLKGSFLGKRQLLLSIHNSAVKTLYSSSYGFTFLTAWHKIK